MTVTDLDLWIRKGVREALEKTALGDMFSFMCGPTLSPAAPVLGTATAVYLIVVTMPSPVLGQTLTAPGLIAVPVDQDELAKLVGGLVDGLRQRAAGDLGVGFRESA
jgi:hypothetical protein